MARVEWSEEALADLQAIRRRIARDNQTAAEAMVDKIAEAAGRLVLYPSSGRVLREGHEGYREAIVRPYRVIYWTDGDDAYVVTVIHGARNFTLDMLEMLDEQG